jgi:HTH-type transcriptional regulator/antitoxin HigA
MQKISKIKNMTLKLIKTKKDYNEAMKRLEEIFDSQPGTKEGDELELLSMLIEKYENEYFPVTSPDPIEAIKFRMEQMGYRQKDLKDIIGYKGRVSEILHRKRKLTLEMIRKLHQTLQIPSDVLLQEY